MTLPQVVQDRLQALSDRKLNTWQEMAAEWHAGSTQPINVDALLSLIVEVKRQRAELHRLTEIADGVEPLVIRLGEVTEKLERANASVERLTHGNLSYAQDNANLLGRESVALKRLEAANALLREIAGLRWFVTRAPFTTEQIQSHLQGAGDEA